MSDLTSKNELKKAFAEYGEKAKFTQGACQQLIDNAPTVEPTFGLFKEMLCSECDKRPQGEWINQEQGAFYPIECSKCHSEPFCKDEGYVLSKFCPECGADMRKGVRKNDKTN